MSQKAKEQKHGTEEVHVSKIIRTRLYCTESDTHIKSRHFVFHMHTHTNTRSRYSLKQSINQNGYTYISKFSYENIPFLTRKLHTLLYAGLSLHIESLDRSARAANPKTRLKLKYSISRSAVAR